MFVPLLQLVKMLIRASQCFSQQSTSIFAALYLENLHEFTVSVIVSTFPRYADLEKPLQICHRAAIQVRAISCNDAEQHVSYVHHLNRSLVTALDPVSGNVTPVFTVWDDLYLLSGMTDSRPSLIMFIPSIQKYLAQSVFN